VDGLDAFRAPAGTDDWLPESDTALAWLPATLRDGQLITKLLRDSEPFRRIVLIYMYSLGEGQHRLTSSPDAIYLGLLKVLHNNGRSRTGGATLAAKLVDELSAAGLRGGAPGTPPFARRVNAEIATRKRFPQFSPAFDWVHADEALLPTPITNAFVGHVQSSSLSTAAAQGLGQTLNQTLLFPGQVFHDSFRETMVEIQQRFPSLAEAFFGIRDNIGEGGLQNAVDRIVDGYRSDEEYAKQNRGVYKQAARRTMLRAQVTEFIDRFCEITDLLNNEWMFGASDAAEVEKIREIARLRLLPLVYEMNAWGLQTNRLRHQIGLDPKKEVELSVALSALQRLDPALLTTPGRIALEP